MSRPIRLFLIRHSKSCSNYVRNLAGTEDHDHPLVAASQTLRDPALSAIGRRMATSYGPTLRKKLADAGFDVGTAVIGSSPLRRAQQTAALLFGPGHRMIFPLFGEHGAIPENTPEGARYTSPDWDAFIGHIGARAHFPGTSGDFVVVGHGSFLRSVAWPAVKGAERKKRFANLDGFLIEGDITPTGKLTVARIKEIPYSGGVHPHRGPDACALPPKIRRLEKSMRKQRGGGVGLPLAYFQDGAQMRGTSADLTGVGLAGSSGAWVRAPLSQTGGQRTRRQRQQQGGFSPSLMGSFVANGQALLPVAAYMGYKMTRGKKQKRQTRKQRRV